MTPKGTAKAIVGISAHLETLGIGVVQTLAETLAIILAYAARSDEKEQVALDTLSEDDTAVLHENPTQAHPMSGWFMGPVDPETNHVSFAKP